MISVLQMVLLPAATGGAAGASDFFALNASDPRVLLAASLGVGFLQWVKWKSDPRTRKKDNWKMIGDIVVAMALIFLVAPVLWILQWLNMASLLMATVVVGIMGKDFFDKAEQKKTKEWFWSTVRSKADRALGNKGDDQP